MKLLNLPAITTAVALTTTTPVRLNGAPRNLTLQGNFIYGSGGATVDAYVQVSCDDNATWIDIAQFHFTTSSGIFLYNLSAVTPHASQVTPTDGTLAANTAIDGILTGRLRVKYVTTGTYAGNTSLTIHAQSIDLAP